MEGLNNGLYFYGSSLSLIKLNFSMRLDFLMLFSFLIGWSGIALAQDRISEEEINVQKLFIDAHKERLLGNYDKAISILEEIGKFSKENPAAFFELSKIYQLKEDDAKAISNIQQAIELDPSNVWYKRLLGQLHQDNGNLLEAASVYENLVNIAPKEREYYYMWAFLLVKSKEIDKAIKVYDQLEMQIGFNEEIARRRHTLYMGRGKTKKAGRELERLVEANPQNTDYRHLLASFYESIFDHDNAAKQYRQILVVNPYDSKAKIALAGSKLVDNQELKYINSLKPIFEQPTVNIDLKIGKIIPLIQQAVDNKDQELSSSLLTLTDILERVHPDEAKAFSAAGDLLFSMNRLDEAQVKFEKTLELDDTVFSVWEQLMFIQFERKDYAALSKTSEAAIDFFPNKVMTYYFNGLSNIQLGDMEEAISVLEEADLMTRDDTRLKSNIQNLLGNAFRKSKNIEKAMAAFEKGLKIMPENPEILSNYSRLIAQSNGDLNKAEKMASKAIQITSGNASYQASLGYIQYKKKEFSEAKKTFERAMNNGGSDNSFILEGYGDVLFQLREVDSAISFWKKALDAGGSDATNLKRKIADRKLYE